jgi:hypothetical protein
VTGVAPPMGTPRATYVPQPSSSAARLSHDDRDGQLAAVNVALNRR